MNNRLPKVFVNNINHEIRNNQIRSSITNESNSIKLDEIFDKNKFLFNHLYRITLKNGKFYESSIISNINNKLLTIDNNLIDIKDIESINEIKK